MASETETSSWRDWVPVVLMSLTTILAAWSAFEASKWGGAMSISFSQASSARIEAARHNDDANRVVNIQVGLYTQWLNAYDTDSTRRAEYLVENFPEPLKTAFGAWVAAEPEKNPEVPRTPFAMPQYKVPDLDLAADSDARADAKFAEALEYNQRSDNYTLLAVLFAVVLFFTALSGRTRTPKIQLFYLGLALVLFVLAAGFLASFPKLI